MNQIRKGRKRLDKISLLHTNTKIAYGEHLAGNYFKSFYLELEWNFKLEQEWYFVIFNLSSSYIHIYEKIRNKSVNGVCISDKSCKVHHVLDIRLMYSCSTCYNNDLFVPWFRSTLWKLHRWRSFSCRNLPSEWAIANISINNSLNIS